MAGARVSTEKKSIKTNKYISDAQLLRMNKPGTGSFPVTSPVNTSERMQSS
jgi:hypothetical protein